MQRNGSTWALVLAAGEGTRLRRLTTTHFDLYERLPELDFSRHILQGQESQLRVVAVPQCGWTDLGTPKRVGEVLRKGLRYTKDETMIAHLNLAAQYARLQRAEQFVS
jgi:hypothetical protein